MYYYDKYEKGSLEDLEGEILVDVVAEDRQIDFLTESGDRYRMLHFQDCCENVRIEDINGDLDDLIGVPIVQADERTERGSGGPGSQTWTFYHFRTIKGDVTIRWLGESNGYYSERVYFAKVQEPR